MRIFLVILLTIACIIVWVLLMILAFVCTKLRLWPWQLRGDYKKFKEIDEWSMKNFDGRRRRGWFYCCGHAPYSVHEFIVHLNDMHELSFEEIANIVEKEYEKIILH